MRNKSQHIPVNNLPSGTREGIIIGRTLLNGPPDTEEVVRSHRDNGHLFILQEKGTTHIEIDFQIHCIKAPALIYIHPNQVHRLISFEHATCCSWIITSENVHSDHLKLLEGITPVNALKLKTETLSIISKTATLCMELSLRKDEKLFDAILKESVNTLVVLAASQYMAQAATTDSHSRFEVITRAFKSALDQTVTTVKSPVAYAGRLNISTPYLNECVKATTGHSVSWHIQQRVVLEAKRLLYHTDKSVKEIAGEMGYDDYSYFTRLFGRITGMTPIAFRRKNPD